MLNDVISMNYAKECKSVHVERDERIDECLMIKVDLDGLNWWNEVWKWCILS